MRMRQAGVILIKRRQNNEEIPGIITFTIFIHKYSWQVPAFATAEESLDFQSGLGTDLTMGDQTVLTAVLDGNAVACNWTVSDEAVAKN